MDPSPGRWQHAGSRLLSLCTVALGFVGCSNDVVVIGRFHVPPTGAGAGASADVPAGATFDTLSVERGTRASFCAGHGPALRVLSSADPGASGCAPGIARELFRYALCSCTDLSASDAVNVIAIDAFDSRNGPLEEGESGGALGLNGRLLSQGLTFSVSGTGIVAGGGTLPLALTMSYGTDLKTSSAIEQTGPGILSVGRDLWSDADIHAGPLSAVARELYLTPGHTRSNSFAGLAAPQTRAFSVSPPCACGSGELLDVQALVAAAQLDNDNSELGLPANALSERLSRGDVPASLGCGRFALTGLQLPASVLQTVSGRVALFVAGDLTLRGDFASRLDPDAELDVFVSGNLVVQGTAQVGMPARPAAVRMYVAGDGPIEISDDIHFAVQLYAPHSEVQIKNPATGLQPLYVGTFGSIFARKVAVSAAFMAVHYDRAVIDSGESCAGSPALRCTRCSACPSGLACVEGACATCRTDEDCCEPFGCSAGKCQPLLYSPPMK